MNAVEVEAPGVFCPLRVSLPADPDKRVAATLEAMRAVARSAATMPEVVAHARSIGNARRLYDYVRFPVPRMESGVRVVRPRVTFRRDPVGFERIRHPVRMVREINGNGWTQGDCDDLAVYAAAVLLALGRRPVFLVMARDEGAFEHVYYGELEGGQLIPYDPQEGYPAGTQAPAVRRLGVEV